MCIQLLHTHSSLIGGAFYLTDWGSLPCELLHKLLQPRVTFSTQGWKRALLSYDYSHPKVDFQKMSCMGAVPTDPEAWAD